MKKLATSLLVLDDFNVGFAYTDCCNYAPSTKVYFGGHEKKGE